MQLLAPLEAKKTSLPLQMQHIQQQNRVGNAERTMITIPLYVWSKVYTEIELKRSLARKPRQFLELLQSRPDDDLKIFKEYSREKLGQVWRIRRTGLVALSQLYDTWVTDYRMDTGSDGTDEYNTEFISTKDQKIQEARAEFDDKDQALRLGMHLWHDEEDRNRDIKDKKDLESRLQEGEDLLEEGRFVKPSRKDQKDLKDRVQTLEKRRSDIPVEHKLITV